MSTWMYDYRGQYGATTSKKALCDALFRYTRCTALIQEPPSPLVILALHPLPANQCVATIHTIVIVLGTTRGSADLCPAPTGTPRLPGGWTSLLLATITLFCNFYTKRSIGTLVLPFCSLLACRTSSCLINSMLIPHGHASTFRSTPLLSCQDQQPAWIINRTHI